MQNGEVESNGCQKQHSSHSPCLVCKRIDGGWHHLTISWDWASGRVSCFFDGKSRVAFAVDNMGMQREAAPGPGGVEPFLSRGSTRGSEGSLVLGQVGCCIIN